MAKLFVVATPIGNLSDMTFRAVEVLKHADFIAAEDTRKAKILFSHFQISKPVFSYHSANEKSAYQRILRHLHDGKDVALISEAGTPCISDPGYLIVKAAVQSGIEVVPIPGASALSCALSISGLPTDRCLFLGFLPQKKGKKKKVLLSFQSMDLQLVIYESPYRLLETLNLLLEIFGDKPIFIGRELTKLFEEKIHSTLLDTIAYFSSRDIKGEFVMVINLKNNPNRLDPEPDLKKEGLYDQ